MAKRGPRGRNWTVEERLVIYLMVREGESLNTLNNALASHQSTIGLSPRTVPESSFNMMKNAYLPHLYDVGMLAELVRKPRPMGRLIRSKKSQQPEDQEQESESPV